MPNYAFMTGKSLPIVENGHIFEISNFIQKVPHTKIFDGTTGLIFRNCNLVNCDVPGDAVMDGCINIHKSFCSNVHPRWIDKGLTECSENCSHVVDTDEVWIDGILVDTIYHYEDKVVE